MSDGQCVIWCQPQPLGERNSSSITTSPGINIRSIEKCSVHKKTQNHFLYTQKVIYVDIWITNVPIGRTKLTNARTTNQYVCYIDARAFEQLEHTETIWVSECVTHPLMTYRGELCLLCVCHVYTHTLLFLSSRLLRNSFVLLYPHLTQQIQTLSSHERSGALWNVFVGDILPSILSSSESHGHQT